MGISRSALRRRGVGCLDLRSDEWKQAFLETARSATLLSYPYDGLFLDQCSVFAIHHPLESIRREMRVNLNVLLIELRRQHPTAILIRNSVYNFRGLNGKMSEDRKHLFAQELLRWSGYSLLNINLGLIRLNDATNNNDYVRSQLLFTCSFGAFFFGHLELPKGVLVSSLRRGFTLSLES